MEKIYLVCRVLSNHCTMKKAFPNEKLAKNYKKYMNKNGLQAITSWVEEIEFDDFDYSKLPI